MKVQVQEYQRLSLEQNQQLNQQQEPYSPTAQLAIAEPPTVITAGNLLKCVFVFLVILVIVYPRKLQTKLPKILWIYTHNEHQAEQMVNQVFVNYYIDYGRRMDYEVRMINSWTAYEWLSEQIAAKITKTMQRVQIDVGVDDLLILAVLIEHGGILLKNLDVIFLDDLGWIESVFMAEDRQQESWACPSSKTGILLPAQQTRKSRDDVFSDSFIAATPQNPLLIQTFGIYSTLMVGNQTQRDKHSNFFYWLENTKAYSSSKLLENCINLVIEEQKILWNQHRPPKQEDSLCNKLNFQFFTKGNPFIDISFTPEIDVLRFLAKEYRQTTVTNTKIVIKFKKDALSALLASFLQNQRTINQLQDSSILKKMLQVKGSKQVFVDTLPERSISICAIFLDEMLSEQISKSYEQLKKQNISDWQAVYFVAKQKFMNQESKTKPLLVDKRLKLVESSSSKGRNIELAATKHCAHNSFALLLNKGERLGSTSALYQLISKVRPREIIGGFIPLLVNKTKLLPSITLQRFNRVESAIVNPNLALMKNASNHFRLFSVQVYKFLPQFDLRDSYGNYFQDRIIFLMSMLDLIRDDITKAEEFYIIRKYANKFNIPRKAVFVQNAFIVTEKIDEIDLQQLEKTFTRIQVESMHSNLQNLIRYKIPFEKLIVFNQGLPFTSFTQKASQPIIPAIIHQAWLGGAMPPAKEYLFNKTARMYPNYEMKLWTLQNITQENFPLTYEILKNIEAFNHQSPYNKFATMADILRHQALYRYGGFWKDAAMHFLKPVLNDFRKYKLALPTDKTIRHRWLQGMCFFGNMKEYPPLWRITNFRNLNRMRIYNSDPMDIAGPIDFRQLIIGKEEYDPEILVLSYQTFYPAQLGQHPAGDLCTRRQSELTKDEFEVSEKGWGILKNCTQIYPYTFGLQHNRYGGSWTDAVFKRANEKIIR